MYLHLQQFHSARGHKSLTLQIQDASIFSLPVDYRGKPLNTRVLGNVCLKENENIGKKQDGFNVHFIAENLEIYS